MYFLHEFVLCFLKTNLSPLKFEKQKKILESVHSSRLSIIAVGRDDPLPVVPHLLHRDALHYGHAPAGRELVQLVPSPAEVVQNNLKEITVKVALKKGTFVLTGSTRVSWVTFIGTSWWCNLGASMDSFTFLPSQRWLRSTAATPV